MLNGQCSTPSNSPLKLNLILTFCCALGFSIATLSQIGLTANTNVDDALNNFIEARNLILTTDSAVIDSGYSANFELIDFSKDTANWDLCSYYPVKILVEDAKRIQKEFDKRQAELSKDKEETKRKKNSLAAKLQQAAESALAASVLGESPSGESRTAYVPSASTIKKKLVDGDYRIGERFWHLGEEKFFLTQTLCEQNFGLSDVECDDSQFFEKERYQRRALKATFSRGGATLEGKILFTIKREIYGETIPSVAIFVPEKSFGFDEKAANTAKYIDNLRATKQKLVEDALSQLGPARSHLFTDSVYVFAYWNSQISMNRVYRDYPSVNRWAISNKRDVEGTDLENYQFVQSSGLEDYLTHGIQINGYALLGGAYDEGDLLYNFIEEVNAASVEAYGNWKSQTQYRNVHFSELPVQDSWQSILRIFHATNDKYFISPPSINISPVRVDFNNDGTLEDGKKVDIQGFDAITASTGDEYICRGRAIIPSFGDACPLVWRKGPSQGIGGGMIGEWIPIRDSILTTLINDIIRSTVKSLFKNQEEVEEMERALKEQEEAQRRWEARLNEIKSNGGQKYIDAFERYDIIVGMPEDLTMVMINRFYRIDRQYESGNSRTLVCAGRLDPNHGLWVTFSGNRVSSISTY